MYAGLRVVVADGQAIQRAVYGRCSAAKDTDVGRINDSYPCWLEISRERSMSSH